MDNSIVTLAMAAAVASSGAPLSLPQLQNLMKRDPESYVDELRQQKRFFDASLAVFEQNPGDHSKSLEEMVMFLSQVTKSYADELKDFPQTLHSLLSRHQANLNPDMRMSFCRALILLRHRNMLEPGDLLTLFFDLFKCEDKALRKFLRDHIVNDIRGINANRKDVRLNTRMQNFMFRMLSSSAAESSSQQQQQHLRAAKISLEIMTELYRRGIWRDEKTVNVIATACFHEKAKIMVPAVRFFLGKDGDDEEKGGKGGNDSDSDDDLPAIRDVKLAQKVNNKNARKRQKLVENIKKAHKKKKKKEVRTRSFGLYQ